ncbi:polysaccharide lyase family 8 super-sandwich domain-containing protein, partial [Flavonifractor hominis]
MKQARRWLSLTLCFAMAFQTLPAVGAADASTVLASCDFQSDAVGEAPQGWDAFATDGADPAQSWVQVLTDPEDPDNQILAVSATQTGYESYATWPLPETIDGEGLVSLRVYFPSDETLNPDGLPDSAGVHLFAPSGKQAVSLMNKGSSSALGHRPGTSPTKTLELQSIETGVWYDLDIRVDVQENTYAVWLDGVQLPADAAEQFSFRYAQDGVSAVRVAAPKNINGTIYADDIVVRTGAAEEIVSVEAPEGIQAAFGTAFAELGLPETVTVTLAGGGKAQVPVSWESADYHPDQPGEQVISGMLETGALYENGLGLKAELQVTVAEDTVDRNITAVADLPAITVLPGTPQENIPFPEYVEVTLEPGGSAQLPVSGWTAEGDYTPDVEGDYVFQGELALNGTVKNPQGLTAQVTVQVRRDVEAEAFQTVKARWREYLIGGTLDESDPEVAAYIEGINTAANEVWATLIKASEHPDRTLLWPELDMNTGTPHYEHGDTSVPAREEFNEVGTSFSRLLSLVKAYSTKGCDLYQNEQVLDEILAGYDLLTKSYYNADAMLYGNWYTWEIGIPQSFLQGLMILGDAVPQDKLDGYLAILDHFVPDSTTGTTRPTLTSPGVMTGANLLDKASSCAMIAVLSENGEQLELVKSEVKQVFRYANNTNDAINSGDDGFWQDGSYIQHEGIAYNGGYGATLYRQIGIFFAMFHDTPWQFTYEDNAQDIVYNSIFEGLEPLIYDGHFMDMTAGRGITRTAENDRQRTVGILTALLPYLGSMPTEEMERRFESMLKYYIGLDEDYFYAQTGNIHALLLAKELMADDTVEPRGEYALHKTYPSMDKTVHSMVDYCFAVSMHSNRTYNHEFINDEGKRTWNISDGMTYLYNGDDQYGGGYWATVDPRRLPGTTTEFVMRGDGVGQDKTNPFPFVGMAVLGDLYGVTGMHLKTLGNGSSKDGTEAKKSWFMFDDEIVALGSGITSNTGNYVETVIDNRRIAADASNEVQVNGVVRDDVLDNGPETEEVTSRFLRISDASDASGSFTIDFSSFLAEAGVKEGESVTVETQIRFPTAVNFFQTNLLDAEGNQVAYTFSRNSDKSYQSRNTDNGNVDTKLGTYKTNSWFTLTFVTDPQNKQFTVTMAVSGSEPVTKTLPYANAAAGDAVKIRFGTQSSNTVNGSLDVNYVKVSAGGQEVFSEDFFQLNTSSLPSWASITQNPAQNVEVTVENVTAPSAPKGTVIEEVSTIHLQGEEGSQIGYYFPEPSSVKVLKEVRTGDWSDVGPGSGEVTNGFATFAFDHGQKPSDAAYAYVVLPNKSEEETQAYADQTQSDITILAQTNDAHVVRENTLHITAGNFWNATEQFVGGIQVSAPACVMVRDGEGELTFSVSDPTQRGDSITVTYDGTATALLSGEGVEVISLDPVTFVVDTTQSYGESYSVCFACEPDSPVVTGVTVSPDTASVQVGTTQQFNAVVEGENEPDQAVTWSVEGAQSETTSISDTGLLTVAEDETAETLTVTATSVADEEFSGTATVTVTAAPVETYTLTVNGGTGSGEYEAGAQITVTANAPEEGMQFVNWTADGLKLEDDTASTLTITMPANAVTLTANYE